MGWIDNIKDAVTGMKDAVLSAVKKAVDWCVQKMMEMVEPMMEGILDALDIEAPDISAAKKYFDVADHYMPITECMSIVAALWVAVVAFIAVRWFIRVCPFIGG